LEDDAAVFAAERYAATLKQGYTLADLRWVAWAPPLDDVPPNPQLKRLIPGFQPAFASDDFLVQLRAAEEGVGAIILGRFAHRASRQGALRELDVSLGAPASRLYLVSSRGALEVPRVRAVADLLAAELRALRTPKRRRSSNRTTLV